MLGKLLNQKKKTRYQVRDARFDTVAKLSILNYANITQISLLTSLDWIGFV